MNKVFLGVYSTETDSIGPSFHRFIASQSSQTYKQAIKQFLKATSCGEVWENKE